MTERIILIALLTLVSIVCIIYLCNALEEYDNIHND